MSDIDNVPRLIDDSKDDQGPRYAVMLPCAPENFADFILGLLGESQVIESKVDGLFVVGRSDILNISDIIRQRIKQQNEASELSWSLTVNYDDGSSVRHSAQSEFETYAEIKEHMATSFTIHMAYLVKFPERKTFEKQIIEVTFFSGYDGEILEHIEFTPRRKRVSLGFNIRIEHTLRSWG